MGVTTSVFITLMSFCLSDNAIPDSSRSRNDNLRLRTLPTPYARNPGESTPGKRKTENRRTGYAYTTPSVQTRGGTQRQKR
ncbi:hypothetical protein HNY73_003355 [Argiope bruennichi]|uniref:Secreted protein n=1 Tax=Argiope bruennichi TaxID=94029 RepID=A0A8T0FQB7_ARGBR|nr:hypothetical protein HNY73_003355 [Argiope bruennichi]